MTTIAFNQAVRGTPAILQRLAQSCSALFAGIAEARAMADRYQTLARMTDWQLAQRGLKREQIPQAVLASFTQR